MKKNVKQIGIMAIAVLSVVMVVAKLSWAAGALFTPTMAFPLYRHDVVKSEGWKELSTPLLYYCNSNAPFNVQSSGDERSANILTVAPDGDLVLPSQFGVFRSRDNGISWRRIDGEGKETRASYETGYPESANCTVFDPQNAGRIAFFFLRGSAYFTNGTTWKTIPNANFDFGSIDWTSYDPQLIAGPVHGTWTLTISRDGGNTWINQENRLTGTGELGDGAANSMIVVVDANTIVYNNSTTNTAIPSGLFRSTNKGDTWTKLRDGLTGTGRTGISIGDGRVYFTSENALWISTDKGATWSSRSTPGGRGLQIFGDWSNGAVGGLLMADHNRVAYSKDEGATWIEVIGESSGNAFPPLFDRATDGDLYSAVATGWVYGTDRCDFKYGGSYTYDPVNNIVYAGAGGPTIFKKLSGTGPGPAAAPHPAGDTAVIMTISPSSLAFNMAPAGTAPAAQSVAVANAGAKTLNTVSTSIAYQGTAGWLAVTASGIGNSQSISNAVTPGTLAEGAYTATVTVTCANASPTTRSYTVVFTIRQSPVFSKVVITPDIDTVISGETTQYAAAAQNQFNENMASQPTFTWTVSGGGTIAATGIFTPGIDSGSYNVYASATVSGVTKTDTAIIKIKKYTPPPPPEAPMKITSPNTKVTWPQGASRYINWQLLNPSAVTSVSLSYTIDDGATWLPIASSLTPRGELTTGNYGRYTWTVPAVNSGQCRVKITEQSGVWSDSSDVMFVIGSVAVLSPLRAGARSSVSIQTGQQGITVLMPDARKAAIKVYNLRGRVVASQTDGNGVFNAVLPGSYIVTVTVGSELVLRQGCVVVDR